MTKFEFRQVGLFFVLIILINVLSSFAQEKKVLQNEKQNAKATTKSEPSSVNSDEVSDETDYQFRRGDKEFNFELGYSPFEPTHFAGPKEYNTVGRKLGKINFRLGRVIGTKKNITYSYLFGFTPFVILPQNEVRNKKYISATETPNEPPTVRETSYGFGFTPINFRFAFFAKSRIKPFAQVGAGILITNKALPIPESRSLNFTGDFGGGLQIHQSAKKTWLFGYKYFHISNGDVTVKKFNPGFNANVFYIGFSFHN